MPTPALPVLSLVAGLAGLPAAAQSQAAVSVYVGFDLAKCTLLDENAVAGSTLRHCGDEGSGEFYVAEAGGHVFVGYGPDGLKQRAFGQTLKSFNSIHDRVEFRVRRGAPDTPYAAILRYHTGGVAGEAKGQVLVVTKLQDAEACHMAYIDALANPGSNALAQRAADAMAPAFDCSRDEPEVIGEHGKSPM